MADGSVDAIRHALTIAKRNGYSEVEIEASEATFHAKLEPSARQKIVIDPGVVAAIEAATAPTDSEITASLVGYYQEATPPLARGRMVEKGDVVAVITALGLANDVESTVAGEVMEVLVTPGQPVEFGQALARVGVPL